mmetsp:Transcript_17604/g.15759  ORF Transcript_17604/g.15759 Transcript_17604/m.15759 type:complete len:149 (+) Transcript_17604:115-561(+)
MKFTSLCVILQAINVCLGGLQLQQSARLCLEGNNGESIYSKRCPFGEDFVVNGNWQRVYGNDPTYFSLKTNWPLNCMDISGGVASPNNNVILYECHGRDNQLWSQDDKGMIRSKLDNSYCLDTSKHGTYQLVVNKCDEKDMYQQFHFI